MRCPRRRLAQPFQEKFPATSREPVYLSPFAGAMVRLPPAAVLAAAMLVACAAPPWLQRGCGVVWRRAAAPSSRVFGAAGVVSARQFDVVVVCACVRVCPAARSSSWTGSTTFSATLVRDALLLRGHLVPCPRA